MDRKPTHTASCHCGAVLLELVMPNGIYDPRRCDCSLCRKKNATMATVLVGDLEVVAGADKLTLYQFNTMTARHYFCSICGIYTHHRRRSNPNEYGVNVACIDGVEPFAFENAPINDGINHPSDR